MPTATELREIGIAAGLTAVGFTHAGPFHEARVTLVSHKERGLHGGMQFTYRNPGRSTTPSRILADAATLIVGAWPYATTTGVEAPSDAAGPRGEIAAYAWRDHYGALEAALGAIATRLHDSGHQARVVADDNALVDRAAAVRAGIGWAGKNSNVLVPGHGSWFVLGAVVTNALLEIDEPVEAACGSCRRCIDACPTGAIIADGVVDARRCLAWLVQAEGDFPLEYREALGTRIYGCDDCQTVCPPSRGAATPLVGDEVASIDLIELLSIDDEALLAMVGRWYIARRDPRYVRRNALVALGNSTVAPEARDRIGVVLRRYLDGDPMLARHARWAGEQLGLDVVAGS